MVRLLKKLPVLFLEVNCYFYAQSTKKLPTMSYQNLLLIDDDEDDQMMFLDAIQELSSSITCKAFDNAFEALNLLVAKTLKPEIIFLDLNMPIMNGEEFLREIKLHTELRAIPVIILSTSSVVDVIDKMMAMGAHDFITKPNSYTQLTSMLKRIIN